MLSSGVTGHDSHWLVERQSRSDARGKGVEGYRLSLSASIIPEVAESTSSVLIFRLGAPPSTVAITGTLEMLCM